MAAEEKKINAGQLWYVNYKDAGGGGGLHKGYVQIVKPGNKVLTIRWVYTLKDLIRLWAEFPTEAARDGVENWLNDKHDFVDGDYALSDEVQNDFPTANLLELMLPHQLDIKYRVEAGANNLIHLATERAQQRKRQRAEFADLDSKAQDSGSAAKVPRAEPRKEMAPELQQLRDALLAPDQFFYFTTAGNRYFKRLFGFAQFGAELDKSDVTATLREKLFGAEYRNAPVLVDSVVSCRSREAKTNSHGICALCQTVKLRSMEIRFPDGPWQLVGRQCFDRLQICLRFHQLLRKLKHEGAAHCATWDKPEIHHPWLHTAFTALANFKFEVTAHHF